MLLVIDTGNTDITFALYDGTNFFHQWRIPSKQEPNVQAWQYRLANELFELGYKPADLEGAVISSVVPSLNQSLLDMLEPVLSSPPLLVGKKVYEALDVQVLNAEEIGTDLVANAVAAYDRFKRKCIVADFGTALTFTTVLDGGRIGGVAIAPGLKTAIRSLFDNTAQLPEVPLEIPETALGSNTIEAIQAGVVIGYTGMVKHMLETIRSEIGSDCKIIATGGLYQVITPGVNLFDEADRMLTMKGLVLISKQYQTFQKSKSV